MKAGDIVRFNKWVYDGRLGVVIEVQSKDNCQGAYILTDIGIKLVSINNMKVVSESR